MKPVVCITEKEYQKAKPLFDADALFECIPVPLQEEAIAEAIIEHKAIAVILGVDVYRNRLYRSLPRGGVIARFGVGHDGIDKEQATQNGLIVTNTPGVLDDSVAEHAILMMGCMSRHIHRQDHRMKHNLWQSEIGNELRGKTLLILGCGRIGKKTARIASFGFGMNVVGCVKNVVDSDSWEAEYGIRKIYSHADEAIDTADFVSVHLPATPSTKHFINASFLSRLKNTCILINTARGPVVDEVALYDALLSQKLAGAALDVFETEPYLPVASDKDLRTLENALLTSHVGSSTHEACRRMALKCLENLLWSLQGQYEKMNILNPRVLEDFSR